MLNIPKMCLKDMENPMWAANEYRGLMSDMIWGVGEVPLSQILVIGLLSVTNMIL